MADSQDRLREMLHRRGDRVHSSLTISDIRDAGLRSHRHPMRLLGPVLVAASVVILVLVVTLTGRTGSPTTPPAGPGPGVSRTAVPTTTAVHSSRIATPSVTGTTTNSLPVTTSTAATTPSTAAATTTVRASP